MASCAESGCQLIDLELGQRQHGPGRHTSTARRAHGRREAESGRRHVDQCIDAAKLQAEKLRGLLPHGDDAKLANALIDHVLAEAAAYPPEKALVVAPLATTGVVGIWAPRGRLKVNLLWVNVADFPIYVRDTRVTARVGGKADEWDFTKGDEFVLNARSQQEHTLESDPVATLPSIERGGAECELTVGALVSGPWDEGRAQQPARGLVRTSVWMPTLGMDPTNLRSDPADIDLMLEAYVKALTDKGVEVETIDFSDLDRTLKLRPGAAERNGCPLSPRNTTTGSRDSRDSRPAQTQLRACVRRRR